MCKVNQPINQQKNRWRILRALTEETQTAHKRTKICSISSIIRRKITGNNPNIISSRRIDKLGYIYRIEY